MLRGARDSQPLGVRKYKNGKKASTKLWKVDDVAKLKKILKPGDRPMGQQDSGKYRCWHRSVKFVWHNSHDWSKELHFPQSREVSVYEGDVWHWQAIRKNNEQRSGFLVNKKDRQPK